MCRLPCEAFLFWPGFAGFLLEDLVDFINWVHFEIGSLNLNNRRRNFSSLGAQDIWSRLWRAMQSVRSVDILPCQGKERGGAYPGWRFADPGLV